MLLHSYFFFYYKTRKKAAAGSWLGFAQPVCFTLRLGLIEVFPFLSFFYSPRSSLWSPLSFPLVTNVYPSSHQGLSLWSLRVFPLVIKVPHLHLHSFEVKCDERRTKNERTNERTGRNHEPCLL